MKPAPPLKRKPVLLMLITELGLGGAERVFYDHVCAFSARYDVKVCVFSKKDMYSGFTPQSDIYELDDIAISNKVKRWHHRKKRLEQLVKDLRVDICISHMEGPNFLNTFSRLHSRRILVVHGSVLHNSRKGPVEAKLLNRFLIPRLYSRADKVVTVSDAIRKEHISIGVPSSRLLTINNFFDLHKIRSLQPETTFMDAVFAKYPVLVHVGRLASEKNQQYLLRILQSLKAAGRAEKLLIIGDGLLRESLPAMAAALQLKVCDTTQGNSPDETSDVFFIGQQENPFKFISKAKLFLLTSLNEGFPLVLGEALACGTPVISVDCPTGPREILGKPGEIIDIPVSSMLHVYTGAIMKYFDTLPETDLPLWTEAVTRLLDDTSLHRQLSANCAEKAVDFSKEKISGQWFKLLDSL